MDSPPIILQVISPIGPQLPSDTTQTSPPSFVATLRDGLSTKTLQQITPIGIQMIYGTTHSSPSSSVYVSQTALKYQNDADIKEVIILYVYSLCLTLLLTMILHLHLERWWPILCPPSGSFFTTRKDVSLEQYIACCWPEPILGGTPVLPVLHLRLKAHRVYPDTVPRSKVLTQQRSANHSAALAVMIVVTCQGLFVVLYVNKCYYWLV